MILVTGSAGLIGRGIVSFLRSAGHAVREFDWRSDPRNDVLDPTALERSVCGVRGIVHLAAVSRVVWAQREPALATRVNVKALENLLDIAISQSRPPWVVFASSREVYGEQARLPVREDAELAPINHYARSKVAGEVLVTRARRAGLVTAICRFSNVYGLPDDHRDRVVPAFARSAALGGELRVDGSGNTFDFTFVDDVVRGAASVIDAADSGLQLPPLHFVTGRSTSLQELAQLAADVARKPVTIREAPSRTYDVAHFCGDPSAAEKALRWKATVSIEDGFRHLVDRIHHAENPVACRQSWLPAQPQPLITKLA